MKPLIRLAMCSLLVWLLFPAGTSVAAGCDPRSRADDQYIQRSSPEFGDRWVPAHCYNFTVMESRTIDSIIIHTTAADNSQSTINWFQNGAQVTNYCGPSRTGDYCRTSSHYLVDVDGTIIQFVQEKDMAHHAFEYNSHSIGIEHVGKQQDPDWPGPTQPMYEASARLVRYLGNKYNLQLTRDNFRQIVKGHDELGQGKSDPGPKWDWNLFMDLVLRSSGGGPPPPVDAFLIVDLSGSFADDLPVFKAQAPAVMASLRATNPDIRFGLAKFEDYPIPPFGYAFAGDKAYERLVDLTPDSNVVLAAISGLFTRYGGDGPQSQLPALYQAATGAGQDLSGAGWPGASIPPGQQASFRDGAIKIILLWTDAPFHQPGDAGSIPYPGPSFDATVNAIRALDPPKVIGISSGPYGLSDLQAMAAATDSFAPADGVDCNADGVVDLLEGQPLVCGITLSGQGIGEAITALVEAASVPTSIRVSLDVKPGSDPNSINVGNLGTVPVAILSTDNFDASSQVNGYSVTFGKTGDELSLAFCNASAEDVNGDGLPDQVCHFESELVGLQVGDVEAVLKGMTVAGQPIEGRDAVNIVP